MNYIDTNISIQICTNAVRLSIWHLLTTGTGARFSKLAVITRPVKLFCFPFQMGVSKLLKVIQ